MTKNKNQNIVCDMNNIDGYAISKFLTTSGFTWIDSKEFDLNRYTSNSSKGCALEVDLELSLIQKLILKNYVNYTMIFLLLQIRSKQWRNAVQLLIKVC